ncbi:MAG: protein usg [Mesorhizobium sp.]|nr:MAG: protein usg [Mesorhizobium sp.]TIX95027.1 MAG: protein usg [Mesorhizobium sp.]
MVSNEFQVSNAFRLQMQGFGLTTAEIHYRLPDCRDLLQLFIWQEYDIAPDFPTLKHFLEYWEREIEGPLHSVRVAHHRLIQPSEWRAVDGVIPLQ